MIMSKLNYLGKEWSNIVFEGRNKLYGAYKLRQENIKNTATALVFGIGGLSLIFGGSSYLYASNSNLTENPNDGEIIICNYRIDVVELEDIKKDFNQQNDVIHEKTAQKQVSSARTDVQENMKLTETIIVDKNKNTEQLTSQDMFTDFINSGVNNTESDSENGVLKLNGENTGLATEGLDGKNRNTAEVTTIVDRVDDKPYSFVQIKAEPKEGFKSFYSEFVRKFSSNDLNINSNEIVVKVKFVVEKDGSFANIQIIDDKFGVGKEAERILRGMPKWKAAQHNGKTVRSIFTLPIKIKLR